MSATLCRSKRGVRLSEKILKIKKKARKRINVNAMIYLKFKIQLKFWNDINWLP